MKNSIRLKQGNKYFLSFVSAFITAVMFVMFLAVNRIAPFGNKFWFVYDMNKQYLDFYSYYKTVFEGNSNLFYSSSISLGSAAIGFFTYYLSSPWLLLTLFFKKSQMHIAVTLMIGIKLVLASFFCDLFLGHYIETSDNEKPSCMKRLIFSVGYSFCTFLISNSLNPMWLDVLYLFPVLIFMLDRLMYTGRRRGYILTLALMVLNNYYMAFMVCIFVVMWTFFRMFASPCDYRTEDSRERSRLKMFTAVAVSSVWGIMLDAVFLIPTVYELGNSPKDIFKLGLETNKGNLGIGEILSKIFCLSYDSFQTITGTPLLYAGTAVILLTILYYLNRRVSVREKIGMGIMMLVFMVSFAIDKINLYWHAGMEPSGYPYREAFLFVFLCLVCGTRCVCNFDGGISKISILISGLITMGILGYLFIIRNRLFYVTDKMLLVNAALVLLITALLLAFKAGNMKEQVAVLLTVLLCVVSFTELLGNGIFVFRTQTGINDENADRYISIVSDVEAAVNHVKKTDDSMYRMENLSPRNRNDAMMFGYNGITHYSSSGSLYARDLLKKMGFNDDGLYADYGYNNTATADTILGVKYLLGADEQSQIHPQYREQSHEGDYVIKENPEVFGPAVFMTTPHPDSSNPFAMQESLLAAATGTDGKVFVPVSVEEHEDMADSHEYRQCICTTQKSGEVFFYLQGIEDKIQNMFVYADGKMISGYGNYGSMKILNLGYYEAGASIDVRIECDSENADFGKTLIYTEDADKLKTCFDEAGKIEVVRNSSSRYELLLPENYESLGAEGIMVTFPYEKGWKAVSGGKSIPVEMCADTMLYIPMSELSGNVIELNFIPEGFNLGLVISLLALLLLIGDCVLRAYRTRRHDSSK